MDQIISLLSKLFDLTKVASVTLPGLLAAGGLTLILWPAAPIDVIPAVVSVQRASPIPSPVKDHFPEPDDSESACDVQHWAMDDVVSWMNAQANVAQNAQANVTQTPYNFGPVTKPPAPQPWATDSLRKILEIESNTNNLSVPGSRKRAILQQFVLDFEARNISVCANLEKSWAGEDDKAIQEVTSDLDNLEKQRTAAQEAYLTYLKVNNQQLADHYKTVMEDIEKDDIGKKRKIIVEWQRAKQERERRADELTAEQQLLKDRLGDPGRLRPRLGFDLFLVGLVNHIVGFILLSLAAAVVVTSFDRAWFGLLYEGLFDGYF